MSPSIISLWSGPRNVSTALMYSFAQRDDTVVLDEPLYAHYLKTTGFDHPGREDILISQENDGGRVIENVFLKGGTGKNLFVKNMAKHLIGLDHGFLRHVKNILLIRDPVEMLPSLLNNVKNPNLQETALYDQFELMLELISMGIPVTVVDCKDLLVDPEGALRDLCQFCGITYRREMLQWEPGPRPEDGIWAKFWYQKVHQSTGFGVYSPKQAHIEDKFRPLLAECQHYYEQLSNYAINKSNT